VNSDASVRRLEKGTDRPIVPEEERARLLAALACVDCVVLFDEETPLALIERLRPDVLVKGRTMRARHRRGGPGRGVGRARGACAARTRRFDDRAARAAPRQAGVNDSSMKLLVATRNEGKIREIRDLFTGLPFQLTFPPDQFLERLPDEADLERGTSFAENAVAKARYFAKRAPSRRSPRTRLEVDALDGAPGVFSARWAQMHGAAGGAGEVTRRTTRSCSSGWRVFPTSSARRATAASWRISTRRSPSRSWSRRRARGGS